MRKTWLRMVVVGAVAMGGLWGNGPMYAQTSTQNDPSPSVLATIDSLRAERDFRTALARLESLAESHPRDVDILWRMSILWSDVGKAAESAPLTRHAYQQALSVAETAVSVDAARAWAHTAKAVAAGRVANQTDSNRESIRLSREVKEHADRAIELDTTLGAAYHVRARWHREVASLNVLQRIVVKTVYGGLPNASYEQAVQDFKRAIALESRAYHHLELGKTYARMGRTPAAREELRAALQTPRADPFDPEYKEEARRRLADLK